MQTQARETYLECEKPYIYWLLIVVAGWFGAYTFILRGGVFCNAQTANVVLFAIALGSGEWKRALYLLLPISAYFFGAFLSEFLGKSVRRLRLLRWDTLLIGIEAAVVLALGCLPENAPDQICQIALNFICSMQFNTFRQVKGIPAATTFVTNHIRQVGANAAKFLRHHDRESGKRLALHGTMIGCFALGTVLCTLCIRFSGYRAIWGAAALLLAVFLRLCYADRVLEQDKWEQVPHGH